MSVTLNGTGKSHAIALINSGKVDKSSGWSMSADDENKLLGDNDWAEYSKWFLGIDASADKETKAHYKYPFGKDGKVYRSALIAIKQRGAAQGADSLVSAAGSMLDKIDGKKEGDSVDLNIERRYCPFTEVRIIAEEGKSPVLRGHAAVFNTSSVDLGGFREIIMPNAFRSALSNSDPRCLFNHDPNLILGRKSANTLRVDEDARGLPFECDMPGTSYSNDLRISMDRGDIKECSFGFSVRKDGDKWEKDSTGYWTRTINEDGIEKLYDVSPVTYPAYPDTSCAMRSLDKIKAEEIPTFDEMAIRKLRLQIESILYKMEE